MNRMPAEEFVRRISASLRADETPAQYALLLGAGCSRSSGIPASSELIRSHWLPKLFEYRNPTGQTLEEWEETTYGVTKNNIPSGVYGKLFQDLFPHPAERQHEVERLCQDAKPKFAYAALSQLIANFGSKLNVTLTVNFDNLLADALYLYTNRHPLIIPHGALSAYIRSTASRPLIVKLHGHYQYSPMNTAAETSQLTKSLQDGVHSLLQDRGLIILGYGGWDQSIKEALEQLPVTALPYGIYWVSSKEPQCYLSDWLEQRQAYWIPESSFETLMVRFLGHLDLTLPTETAIIRTFTQMRENYSQLARGLTDESTETTGDPDLLAALDRVDRKITDWGYYEIQANRYKRTDSSRVDEIYKKGLANLPQSVELRDNYANFLKDDKRPGEAERYYLEAIELAPAFVNALHDYAIFLWRCQNDPDRARQYIQRAIDSEASDPIHLSNFANFFWQEDHDLGRALQFYQRSVAEPYARPEPFRQFGVFAFLVLNDLEMANEMLWRAQTVAPDDLLTLLARADLAMTTGDLDTAEELLRRAHAVDESRWVVLERLATLYLVHRQDSEAAGRLFEAALQRLPEDEGEMTERANFLLAYASLLIGSDRAKALELAKGALDKGLAEPGICARYSGFLAFQADEVDDAFVLIDEALQRIGDDPLLLSAKADLYYMFRNDLDAAESLYRQAIESFLPPQTSLANLAGILTATGRIDEGISLARRAVSLAGFANPEIVLETAFYLYCHGPIDERSFWLQILKFSLERGYRSKNWNLEPNIRVALEMGHSESSWIQQLGQVIAAKAPLETLTSWGVWEQAKPPRFTPIGE